ncbi:MAG: hypothetical protein ACOY4T_15535 [Pseudomonadota bacterium]
MRDGPAGKARRSAAGEPLLRRAEAGDVGRHAGAVGVCFGANSGSVFAARRLPTVLAAEAVSL